MAAESAARVPLRAPLLARAPARCLDDSEALRAYDGSALGSCADSLTLQDFSNWTSKLPACNFSVRGCSTGSTGSTGWTPEERAAHVVLAVTADVAVEIEALNKYVCKNNVPLIVLLFDNASCFHRILAHLNTTHLSFLFFDRHLEMYGPGVFPVRLKEAEGAGARCPARYLNDFTGLVHRLGDGREARNFTPQIADVVERFCPSLKHLKEVLHDRTDDVFEEAACRSFSQIYERIKLPGVGRELSFQNGTVETVTVYLERWRGGSREMVATWDLRRDRPRALDEATCGVRVRDRPRCAFPAGARGFERRCLDLPLGCALALLALLPLALAAARRARLKRLAVRDLNLLAHMLEEEPLTPVVHEDALCLHEKIGMGNFGSVYLATLRRSMERAILVAAKELRDESDKREYLQEAGTLQQVDHENIVKFVGICLSKGSLLILMEYARHGDLVQYLRARRHLPATDPEAAHVSARALTRLASEAAAALAYLARCGVVHRDVRAANCLVDERRTLKLADFGLARKLCGDREYTSIRRTVLPVLWMAPESMRGTFSAASDVWALGVLLLELATLGERPYGACPPHLVLPHVLRGGHPPLPPDATPQTVGLVMACWQVEPAARAPADRVQQYLVREPLALRPARLPAPHIAGPADTSPLSPSC